MTKGRREIFGTALNNLIIQGEKFECPVRFIKQRSTSKTPKANVKKITTSDDSLKELRNDHFSDPFFRLWSKEKRIRTKHNGQLQGRQSPKTE